MYSYYYIDAPLGSSTPFHLDPKFGLLTLAPFGLWTLTLTYSTCTVIII